MSTTTDPVVSSATTTESTESKTQVTPDPREIPMRGKERDDYMLHGDQVEIAKTETAAKEAPADKKNKSDQELNFKNLRESKDRVETEFKSYREKTDKELADLRKQIEGKTTVSGTEKAADKQPETARAETPKAPEKPKRPKLSDFKAGSGYEVEKYDVAVEQFEKDFDDWRAKSDAFQRATEQHQKQQKELTIKLEEANKRLFTKYGEEQTKDTMVKVMTQIRERSTPEVMFALDSSPCLPDLLYTMGSNFDLPALLDAAKTNPGKAVRVIAQMERDIIAELEKGAVATIKTDDADVRETKKVEKDPDAGDDADSDKDDGHAARTVSAAPRPPRQPGGASRGSEDPLKSAVANDDFDSFKRVADERHANRKKRGF